MYEMRGEQSLGDSGSLQPLRPMWIVRFNAAHLPLLQVTHRKNKFDINS